MQVLLTLALIFIVLRYLLPLVIKIASFFLGLFIIFLDYLWDHKIWIVVIFLVVVFLEFLKSIFWPVGIRQMPKPQGATEICCSLRCIKIGGIFYFVNYSILISILIVFLQYICQNFEYNKIAIHFTNIIKKIYNARIVIF